jgi:hypothetical protein
VELHDGADFQGHNVELKPGVYDYPAVGGIGNRKLSSFKVPKELMMIIYSRPGKQGEKLTYIGPIEVRHMGAGWNNKVSCIEVIQKK